MAALTDSSLDLSQPVHPGYGAECVTALIPALLEGADEPAWLPAGSLEARCVVLFVLDGLGWNQLGTREGLAPTLSALDGGPITTVAPTTTATALTSITTGRPPGEHGVVGYRVAVEEGVLNTLRWSVGGGGFEDRPDPRTFQPCPTFGAQRPPVVTRAEHAGSGFSRAHLADVRMIGYQDRSGAVDAVVDAAGSAEAFVYAYWDGIDRTAHEYGFGERYDEELTACDAMVAAMLDRLAPDTALLVTADHGQVEVGERMLTLPGEVSALVDRQSGEARFRWLHSHPGSATDLLAASQEAFGALAWVVGVDEAVNSGWFGPMVTPAARARLGDVALVAREQVGFVDPAEVMPIQLICRHGSLSADETFVPLVGVVT